MQRETIEILKNFSSINQGILFRPGNNLRTISEMNTVFASALVPDEFPREFAIYDLNEFLSTLSLFPNPQIDYKDTHVEIKSGRSRAKYFYSAPEVIVAPPANKKMPVEAQMIFNLKSSTLDQIMKAASVMKLKELEISMNGLRAFNKSQVGNQYSADVDDLEGNITPKVLRIESIKLLSRDYRVHVGDRAVRFETLDSGLEYVVALESD